MLQNRNRQGSVSAGSRSLTHAFVMAGGGTGGHVFPALAVARVLRDRGHRPLFIGTKAGMESRLVPEAGFEIEFIEIGGFNRVGAMQKLQTALKIPGAIAASRRILRRLRAAAVFSMGSYVAGPVMLAAITLGLPLIVMEPNAIPGIANRKVGRRVYRALLGFEAARPWFPPGKSEVTGLPIRPEFFQVTAPNNDKFTVLVTGGSRGARTLNRASRESWPLLRENNSPIRLIHQTGANEHENLAKEFSIAGVDGEVIPFIANMPEAYAQADLVVTRAGAGAVSEIAAAGMPSILVPLPFAADDHQRLNAEALANAGAARIVLDKDMNGERLFREINQLRADPSALQQMRGRVRQFAKPGAAERAADVLIEAAERALTLRAKAGTIR
ncbi:MAG TPA: undecaprenyldiphospho-muramoylpentapeptide beta-N-acetylglucosaminyltransferase [Bryobacteraceae bacterium]|jgi:UDP-N-acetylglucosamine--N-acetylmuramyl-(pentapeptide) pyrophosphoryl-undecaprenol N-acetylglucosamine transferase|nr:undecaprenyldiphospho-muramoylpentapeptide beta-N-acetylglucosaminyltransferase [Bryobacteraceae bacterium]